LRQKAFEGKEIRIGRQLSGTSARYYPSKLFARTQRRKGTEVHIETFIRKQLRLKAHTVTKVEQTDEFMVVYIDRLGGRLLRCGVCRQRCREVHDLRSEREWRDLGRVVSSARGAGCAWRIFPGPNLGHV
jgi:hypothetical protein